MFHPRWLSRSPYYPWRSTTQLMTRQHADRYAVNPILPRLRQRHSSVSPYLPCLDSTEDGEIGDKVSSITPRSTTTVSFARRPSGQAKSIRVTIPLHRVQTSISRHALALQHSLVPGGKHCRVCYTHKTWHDNSETNLLVLNWEVSIAESVI
jgi:hypothetical protein